MLLLLYNQIDIELSKRGKMALVFTGSTRCVICNEVIEKGQDYVAFPAFVSNKRDPLINFHDAACHQDCFTNHPFAPVAQTRLAELDIHGKRPYLCTVCGLEMMNPDDFFVLPHWTDDTDSKLYEFNYLKFHLSHLSQ